MQLSVSSVLCFQRARRTAHRWAWQSAVGFSLTLVLMGQLQDASQTCVCLKLLEQELWLWGGSSIAVLVVGAPPPAALPFCATRVLLQMHFCKVCSNIGASENVLA